MHYAAHKAHVEAIKVLAQLGVNKEAKDTDGRTALHHAAGMGHVEAVKVLEQLGAQIDTQDADGETPLQYSIRNGHHQVAQLLRELERAAHTQLAAATLQAARQDIADATEAAERMAAQLIEEEEREQAAQRKVRVAPPSPTSGSTQRAVGVVSDAAFLSYW